MNANTAPAFLGEHAIEIVAAVLDRALVDDGADLARCALQMVLPGISVLRCDAADVLEEPWRSYASVDAHLVDTSNHCTRMTSDPAEATAILLAVKEVVQ